MEMKVESTVFDCADPRGLARFWQAVTGYELAQDDDEWSLLEPPGGGHRLAFQRVPESKSVKNRLHLDLGVPDEEDAAARLEELGATRLYRSEDPDDVFVTLADPEGNELCVVRTAD